jgi:hypothetical protein
MAAGQSDEVLNFLLRCGDGKRDESWTAQQVVNLMSVAHAVRGCIAARRPTR